MKYGKAKKSSASTAEERRGAGVHAPEPNNRILMESPQSGIGTLKPSIKPEGERESHPPRGELPPPSYHPAPHKSTSKTKNAKKITSSRPHSRRQHRLRAHRPALLPTAAWMTGASSAAGSLALASYRAAAAASAGAVMLPSSSEAFAAVGVGGVDGFLFPLDNILPREYTIREAVLYCGAHKIAGFRALRRVCRELGGFFVSEFAV